MMMIPKIKLVQCVVYKMAFRIRIPLQLDQDQKDSALELFDLSIVEASSSELIYINKTFERVYKRLVNNEDRWKQHIVKIVDYMLRSSKWEGMFTEENKIVIACAFYICNPNDAIPDYIPEIGYIDDAYIVNEALSRIYHVNRTFHRKIINFCERMDS